MDEKVTMKQGSLAEQVNLYLMLSFLALSVFFFVSLFLAPLIMINLLYMGIWKAVLFLAGCGGSCIGINLFIKQWKKDLSLSMLIRISIGTLINFGIIALAMQFKPPDFTGVIIEKYDFASAFCLSLTEEDEATREAWEDGIYVSVESSTPIYMHDGIWPWQKRLVGLEALHPGQRVKVMFDGFILLTGSIDAIEIIILGDGLPFPNTNDRCGSMLEGV